MKFYIASGLLALALAVGIAMTVASVTADVLNRVAGAL